MESIDYSRLGKRIRYFRKIQCMTQEQLAVSVDLSQKHISNIECSHSIPTLQTFVKICNCLKVPPDQLLTDSIHFTYDGQNNEIASLLSDCTQEQIKEIKRYILFVLQNK